MRLRRTALVPALLFCCAGCASGPRPAASAQEGTAAERPPDLAKVEARFIPDPARIAPALREDQDFVPPHPIVTHLPRYPAGHEDAGGPVVVVLRFIVGEDGAVREVKDSPLQGSNGAGGRVADPVFREAAVDAVLGWIFVPAAIRTLKPGADLDHDAKPDYTVLVDSERMPVYLDVRFTFEITDGEARVRID